MNASTQTQVMNNQLYERMFGNTGMNFDLYEGTVRSSLDSRIIYLSEDIIRGIYDALKYEAGESWGLVLKSAGRRWGRRVSVTLDEELRAVAGRPIDVIGVQEYTDLLENYFAHHGWGVLRIDLSDAPERGIVHAHLTNSIFSATLAKLPGRVNQMFEGMLAGIFETISGQAIDCVEILNANQSKDLASDFLLSGTERVEAIRPQLEASPDLAHAQALLRGGA